MNALGKALEDITDEDVEEAEAAAVEAFHSMSMSKEPDMACFGRLMKAVIPAYANAVHDEYRRETKPIYVMGATEGVIGHIGRSLLGTLMEVGAEQESTIKFMVERFEKQLRQDMSE